MIKADTHTTLWRVKYSQYLAFLFLCCSVGCASEESVRKRDDAQIRFDSIASELTLARQQHTGDISQLELQLKEAEVALTAAKGVVSEEKKESGKLIAGIVASTVGTLLILLGIPVVGTLVSNVGAGMREGKKE